MLGTNSVNGCRRSLWLGVLTVALFGFIASSKAQIDEPKQLHKEDIAAIIDTVLAAYEQHYVYPDTARALSEHIRKRFAEGKYDAVASRAPSIRCSSSRTRGRDAASWGRITSSTAAKQTAC